MSRWFTKQQERLDQVRTTIEVERQEREASAALRHAKIGPNDPRLFKPVRCEVRKPFMVSGRRVEIGEVIELPQHDATSMQALKRVAILSD